MNRKMLEQFFAFVKEREAIRVKRATGAPWPWSRDPILNNYHWLERLSNARADGVTIGSNRHITFFGRTRKGVTLMAGEQGAELARQLQTISTHIDAMRLLIDARVYLGPFTANQIVSDLALLGFGQLRYDMPCVVSAGSRIALGLITGSITFKMLEQEKKKANRLADEHVQRNGRSTEKGSRKSYYMFGWFRRIHDFVDDPAESAALARLVKDRRARALQLASVDVEHSLCEFWKYISMQRNGTRGKSRFHMSLP